MTHNTRCNEVEKINALSHSQLIRNYLLIIKYIVDDFM